MDFIFISVLETGIWPILSYPEIKKAYDAFITVPFVFILHITTNSSFKFKDNLIYLLGWREGPRRTGDRHANKK